MDDLSPYLWTRKDTRVGDRAEANNVAPAHVPADASWLNGIEPQCCSIAMTSK